MSKKPKRKFSDDLKRKAVDDYTSGRKTAAEVAQEHDVAQGQVYQWKIQLEEKRVKSRVSDLEDSGMSPSEARYMQRLEDENTELKKKLAEQVIVVDLLKKLQTSANYQQLKNARGYDEIAELLAQSRKRVRR
jgi:transposase-like protein